MVMMESQLLPSLMLWRGTLLIILFWSLRVAGLKFMGASQAMGVLLALSRHVSTHNPAGM